MTSDYPGVESWLWGLSVIAGALILSGHIIDGPVLPGPGDWIAGGMGLGMGIPLFIGALMRLFGPVRTAAWRSRHGLPCKHGKDPLDCHPCHCGPDCNLESGKKWPEVIDDHPETDYP